MLEIQILSPDSDDKADRIPSIDHFIQECLNIYSIHQDKENH